MGSPGGQRLVCTRACVHACLCALVWAQFVIGLCARRPTAPVVIGISLWSTMSRLWPVDTKARGPYSGKAQRPIVSARRSEDWSSEWSRLSRRGVLLVDLLRFLIGIALGFPGDSAFCVTRARVHASL